MLARVPARLLQQSNFCPDDCNGQKGVWGLAAERRMPAISLLPVDPSTRRTQPGPSEYAVTSVYVDSAQQRDWNRGRRSHREPGRQHLADIQRLPANLERGVDAALSAPSPDGRSSPTLNATPLRIEVQSRDRRSSGSVKGRKSPRSPGSPGPVKGAAAFARRHLGLESPEVRGVLALPDVRGEREPGLGRLLLDGELLGSAGGSRERRGAYTYVTAFEYDMLEDKMQEVVQERDAAVEEIGRLMDGRSWVQQVCIPNKPPFNPRF